MEYCYIGRKFKDLEFEEQASVRRLMREDKVGLLDGRIIDIAEPDHVGIDEQDSLRK